MKKWQKQIEQAEAIENQIEMGKVRGAKNISKAKMHAGLLRHYAAKNKARVEGNAAKRSSLTKARAALAAKRKSTKKPFVQEQGQLPNFLGQMDMVRIEELVAQKIYDNLAKDVAGTVLKKVKKAV